MFGMGEKTPEQKQAARNKALLHAAKSGNVDNVRKLLDEGADIEARTGFWENTPLIAAAWRGQAEVVRLLLDRGAKIEAVNAIRDTALNIAVQNGNADTVKLLLERGAALDTPDEAGRTPLGNAVHFKRGEMITLIAAHVLQREAAAREALRKLAEGEDAARKQAAEQRAALEREAARRTQKEYAEVVVFTQKIGDLVLEDAFNFASFERLTFVRKGPGGDVQSMARQSFQEMGNQQLLRRAFQEHVKRGGTAEECDVFPNEKPRLGKIAGGQP